MAPDKAIKHRHRVYPIPNPSHGKVKSKMWKEQEQVQAHTTNMSSRDL